MRLFVAVELDRGTREAAEDAAHALAHRLDARIRLRWIPIENLHLTVRFIGHVDDATVPAVLAALGPPLPIGPFDVELNGPGVFPPTGPPRVLWVGLSQGMPSLLRMHEVFNERLAPLGFGADDRPFNAHLTLARIKESPGKASRSIRDVVSAVRTPSARCAVCAATVFQSLLSARGSTYQRLLDIPCVEPAI